MGLAPSPPAVLAVLGAHERQRAVMAGHGGFGGLQIPPRPSPCHKWVPGQEDDYCILCSCYSSWGCHEPGKMHTKRIARPWEYVTPEQVEAMMQDEQRDICAFVERKNQFNARFGICDDGPGGRGGGSGSGSGSAEPPPPPRYPPPGWTPSAASTGPNVYHGGLGGPVGGNGVPGVNSDAQAQGPTQFLLALPSSDAQAAGSQDAGSQARQNAAPAAGSQPWVRQAPSPWSD